MARRVVGSGGDEVVVEMGRPGSCGEESGLPRLAWSRVASCFSVLTLPRFLLAERRAMWRGAAES
jgi:hypothetical protein